jgi:acetylornithine deacetylase/succinyl-diaminopimelate desuccinylase-like protein
MPDNFADLTDRLRRFINRERLVTTVTRVVARQSRTGEAGPALDEMANILREDGFSKIERPTGGHPVAPAVAVRLESGRPGRTIQFNGHLDTVHLPFVPPSIDGDLIRGSGACDMKGGTCAAVEALRALRDSGLLTAGSVLFTAHDLHEAPWGFGEQLNQLIRDGYVGDAVLIPEPLCSHIPTVGRGNATWKVTFRRPGPPVHEVYRPLDEPSVIDAGAEFVARLRQMSQHLATRTDSQAGSESVFIGQVHSGEIYNQFPQTCWLQGTRRWLPGASLTDVEQEFRRVAELVAQRTRTTIDIEYQVIRDAFRLDTSDPLVGLFREAHAATSGRPIEFGPKAFVDDGCSFWSLAGVAAITHGPRSGGAHTVEEWVSVDDLQRVALLYAVTTVAYCQGEVSNGQN